VLLMGAGWTLELAWAVYLVAALRGAFHASWGRCLAVGLLYYASVEMMSKVITTGFLDWQVMHLR